MRSDEISGAELRRSCYSFTRMLPREHAIPTGGSGRSGRQDRDHPDDVERDDRVDGDVPRSFADNLKDRGQEEPVDGGGARDDCLGSAQPPGTDADGQGDGQRVAPLAEAVGSAREGDQRTAQSPGVGEDGSGRSQEGTDEAAGRPERDQRDVLLREGDTDATLQSSPQEALLAWTDSLRRGDIVKLEYSTKVGQDAVFCIR